MEDISQYPLPALDSPRIQELGWSEHSNPYIAYARVLQAEQHACQLLTNAAAVQESKGGHTVLSEANGVLISVRVAGYMLLELAAQSSIVGVRPSAQLVEWLTPSPQNSQYDVIVEIGTLLREKFIRAFRTSTSTSPYYDSDSPSSSPESSRSTSFESLEEMTNAMTLECTRKDYRTSKDKALARDGYRCVVTGILDFASVMRFPELRDSKVPAIPLEVAQIFRESTVEDIDLVVKEDTEGVLSGKPNLDTAPSALAILQMFGFSQYADAFAAKGGVHEVRNLITLEYNVYSLFNMLQLWFESTDEPHQYKLCTFYESHKEYVRHHLHAATSTPIFVKFNACFEGAQPPDPVLLAFHAICARVACMSGATEFFNQMQWSTVEETHS